MRVLGINFGNPGGDAEQNWESKMAKVRRKFGMWKKRRLSITGRVLVVKADILPALLHLAYVFPLPQMFRRELTREVFKFIWGGYEYVKRTMMYQPILKGGRGVPCIPLKLDVLYYCNIGNILNKPYIHKCQSLIRFWLSGPLRQLIEWDNSVPRAESRPVHYATLIKWREKHLECKDKDLALNHKTLYWTLVEKTHIQRVWVKATWKRAQGKDLSNGCKDFNWLLLHRKIPVRSIMYAHRLSDNKNCPRSTCHEEEETIELVMSGCVFAQDVWREMQVHYECVNGIHYDELMFLIGKGKRNEVSGKISMLMALTKLYLWKARQGYILGSYKWTARTTCRVIIKEIEKTCFFGENQMGVGYD